MFSTYDSWKLATPEEEFEAMYGYDPCKRAEDEDEWLWLDSLENPQPIDEFDLDEIPAPDPEDYETIVSMFAALAEGQKPLGADFEAVWDANVGVLHET